MVIYCEPVYYGMLYTRTGLLLVLLFITGFSAQNVIAQGNVTVVPIEPVLQPQSVTQVGPDITGVLAMVGAGLTFFISRMNDRKAQGETGKLLDGGLAIANVANRFVNSLKETDYSDQDSARLFHHLVLQLNKVPELNAVLNEKIKTGDDTDLLVNDKSILQASQDNMNDIVRDNKQYYENLIPGPDDTCDNRLVRAVSHAVKMTSRNG